MDNHSTSVMSQTTPEESTRAGQSHVPVHYAKGTTRNVVLLAVLLAFGLVAAYVIGTRSRHHTSIAMEQEVEQAANAPVPVDVVRVKAAPAQKLLALPGAASAYYETTLYGRVSGYVKEWKADIGDHVKKGDVLALIDTPELDDQFRAAQAKVNQLQADVHVAQTSMEFAKVSYGRYKASVSESAVSQEEVDQKLAEMNSTQARVESAKAQLESGNADVNRLTTLLNFKKVTAPFDGVITQRQIDIGVLVTAGSTTNTTPLYTIAQADRIRVFVDVPQAAVPEIRDGMDVVIESREYPDRQFHGKVSRTAAAIDATSKTLKVEVLVPNKDLALLPGMFVMASFQTSREHPPLRIPPAALTFGPDGAEVAVIGEDDRVTFRPVKIGRDMGDALEIASGLTGNETVALNVGSQVTDGQKVEPHVLDASGPAANPGKPALAAGDPPNLHPASAALPGAR